MAELGDRSASKDPTPSVRLRIWLTIGKKVDQYLISC